MGDKGGKTDMERMGIFKEMGYISIGDNYKSKAASSFNEAASKGRQMLPGGSKIRAATQQGYFTDKFGRVFDGESYSDPIGLRRRYRMDQSKKNLSKPFLPSNGDKMMNGLGTFFGTIGGYVDAFSPVRNQSKNVGQKLGRNVQTNPGKKGTGYGYANVTLSPYPAHSEEPFFKHMEDMKKALEHHKSSMKGSAFKLNMYPVDYFDINPYRMDKPMPKGKGAWMPPAPKDLKPFKPSSPAKWEGGCKAGTFDPYPSHSEDPYVVKVKKPEVDRSQKNYIPPGGPKTCPVNSIVDQNVKRSINVQNYRAMTIA